MTDTTSRGDGSRVAIVTGASRGIGAAIAERLARDGFAVAVNYRSGASDAERIVATIRGAGGRGVALEADVADAGSVRRLFDGAERELGTVDVLVNNAGVLIPSPIAKVDDDAYARQIAVNLTGSFLCMREAARRLRDGGRIVNLSTSVIGRYPPGLGVYAATKAAVEALTSTLAKELGSRAITVNAVAPGPVATALLVETRTEAELAALTHDIPFGRLGTPEEIADVVSFLAGRESGWISGQTVRANGGRN